MTHRTLTPAQNYYVETLALRQLRIAEQVDALSSMPMTDRHEETGLPIGIVCSLLLDAAEATDADMIEALS